MFLKNKIYWGIIPATLLISTLFGGGLIQGFLQSFGLNSIIGESKFTLENYNTLFSKVEFIKSLKLSFRVSILSTLISSFLALINLMAFFIIDDQRENQKSEIFKNTFTLSMVIPYIVAGYMGSLLLTKGGWLSGIFYKLHIIDGIDSFPTLIYEEFGIGIIITYVWKTFPFLIIVNLPVLNRIDEKWVSAGMVFGATKMKLFWNVVFPVLIPSFLTSTFIIFAYTFSAFEIPYLLGVTYPKGLSVLAYDIFSKGNLDMRGVAMAINVFLASVIIAVGIIMYKVNMKYTKNKFRSWR